MRKYERFVGETFNIKGFVDLRTVEIKEVYLLGGSKRYPAFRCEITKSIDSHKIGERENILTNDVVRNGTLKETIKVLSR